MSSVQMETPIHPNILCIISEMNRIFFHEDPQYILTSQMQFPSVVNFAFHIGTPLDTLLVLLQLPSKIQPLGFS